MHAYNVSMLDAAWLERRLPVHGMGRPLVFHPRLGSTNTLAAELAAGGADEGVLVVAEEQTEGRGRHGRPWRTPPGSALALSLVLRPKIPAGRPADAHLAAFNIVGALAVAEALEALGARPGIKWPNDVLLAERKVAGVLLEVSWVEGWVSHLVLGIGVNVYVEAAPPEAEVDFPATSVEAAIGRRVSREELLVAIVEQVGLRCRPIDPPAVVAAANERLAFRDRTVEVSSGGQTWRGRLMGIGPGGEALLAVPGLGEVHVAGSDPRLRPVDRQSG